MRIQCDACEKNPATVMCCADEAALCAGCDVRIHAANKLSTKHARVSLVPAPEPAKCDICQERRGFFFCLEDRALLCRDCDVSIHTANTLSCNHKRFLVTGARVALEELKDDAAAPELSSPVPSPACSAMSSQSSHLSRASTLSSPTSTLQGPRNPAAQPPSTPKAAAPASVYRPPPAVASFTPCPLPAFSSVPEMRVGEFAAPQLEPQLGMRRSSIGEFLTDAVPGWRVDELLNFADCGEGLDLAAAAAAAPKLDGGDYDWTADLSLFEEQMFAMHEVPQFPPAAPQLAVRAPRHVRGRATRNHDLYDLTSSYHDAFIVPEIRTPPAPAFQSLPKRTKRDLYHMSTPNH